MMVPEPHQNCTITSKSSNNRDLSTKTVSLLSKNLVDTPCGKHQPWVIKRKKEEQIVISILDFTGVPRNFSSAICDIIVETKELPSGHPVRACAGDYSHPTMQKHKPVIVSEAESLEVSMSASDKMGNYIVKVECEFLIF